MSNDGQWSELRGELEAERTSLVAQLLELGADASLEFDHNFADSSQVTAERGELGVLVGSLKDALDDVESALHRLEAGEYGFCENCGQAIEAARLEAMPTARRCLSCATKRH